MDWKFFMMWERSVRACWRVREGRYSEVGRLGLTLWSESRADPVPTLPFASGDGPELQQFLFDLNFEDECTNLARRALSVAAGDQRA
jgi:hypothetical protein